MRIGLLTGGGDAPGLNGIIESVSRCLLAAGHQVVGSFDGFEGVFNGNFRDIRKEDLVGLHGAAGTFLGTSNRSRIEGREKEFIAGIGRMEIQGLIAAGGDGTFSALSNLGVSVPIIGVPKTIDNDLHGTDITFGFDTACAVVADAADSLRSTADAHRRIMIVEAMGRTAGWIALGGGLASYADVILVPERPFNRKALLNFLRGKQAEGRRGLVMVVSESAKAEGEDAEIAFTVKESFQQERFGGIAQKLSRWIEAEIQWESRAVVLGHLQRSRSPTTTDRFLTAAVGIEAARMAMEGDWNKAVVYKQGTVQRAPLSVIQAGARTIPSDHRWVKMCEALGIFI